MAENNRVFLSCVSDDFEKPDAPFAGLRSLLAVSLRRADYDVKYQEEFSQTPALTVLKLADYVRTCTAVLHLVGERPGCVADPAGVAEFLTAVPAFLDKHPELRAALGTCADLTYTQWEAFQALHYGVTLLVYSTPAAEDVQLAHLNRLRQGGRHWRNSRFTTTADLAFQLLGDLRRIKHPATVRPPYFPFVKVTTGGLYGRGGVGFRPSREEFDRGLIHRPALADEVEVRLTRERWALVRGHGAAGKTTLALLVGLAHERGGGETFYLDLMDGTLSTGEACREMARMAESGADVLFVVDNVHLNEEAASHLYDTWTGLAPPARLLLLGRHVQARLPDDGRQSALATPQNGALALKVGEADLAGVVARLAGRPAPAGALRGWLDVFKGDLIAFGAAVAGRVKELQAGDFTLEPRHAEKTVREQYLFPPKGKEQYSDAERSALLTVARSFALELPLPGHLVVAEHLARYVGSGVVFEGAVSYRLVHPGVGKLLGAADPTGGESFAELGARDPVFGFRVARRLEPLPGRGAEAAEVVRRLAREPRLLVEGLVGPLMSALVGNVAFAVRTGCLTEAEADALLVTPDSKLPAAALRTRLEVLNRVLPRARDRLPRTYAALTAVLANPDNVPGLAARVPGFTPDELARFLEYTGTEPALKRVHTAAAQAVEANPSAVLASALGTGGHPYQAAGLQTLTYFLGYARRHLPRTHAAIAAALADPADGPAGALVGLAVRSSPDVVAGFLNYARMTPGFLPTHRNLAAALCDPTHLPRFVEKAVTADLEKLTRFLRGYAEHHLPVVHAAAAAALADPDGGLVGRALASPLGTVANFLAYARTAPGFVPVYQTLADALADPAATPTLTDSALGWPLDQLASFLDYAQRHLPAAYALLTGALVEPVVLPRLAGAAADAPPDNFAALLGHPQLSRPLVVGIDLGRWAAGWANRTISGVQFVSGLFRCLFQADRPELAAAPAGVIVRNPNWEHWRAIRVGIVHLSYVLRSGRGEGADALSRFLDAAIDTAWVEGQYAHAPVGPLAGSLYGLWRSQDEPVLARFRLPGLGERVRKAFPCPYPEQGPDFSAVVQLLGCAALVAGDARVPPRKLPDPRRLRVALAASPITTPGEFGHFYVQFWLGIRELARAHRGAVTAPPEVGERILARWQAAVPRSDREVAFNAWMIDWLKASAADGWRLAFDPKPLASQWTDPLPSAEPYRDPSAPTPDGAGSGVVSLPS